MSNPNASIFALSALGIFMLAENVLASVSVIGGQITDSRNQVVTLRVAAEPLAVDEAAASLRGVRFNAPSSVKINPAGERAHRVRISAVGFVFFYRDHGRFTVTKRGNGLSIMATENRTGCPISDQIDAIWLASHVMAYMAINVTQNSNTPPAKGQKCPSAMLSQADAQADASETESTQSAELSAVPTDFDAAIRRRAADGSNAVRIILSSADVSTGTMGTTLTRILQACERQKVWCLLDPGLTAPSKPGTSSVGGVQYFVSADVRTALLEHQDHVMLVLRESDTAALGPRAVINQLRAAGLPHMLIFSMNSLRTAAGGLVDAAALLGSDGYQAVALAVDPEQASMDATSVVPVVAMPEAEVEEPMAAADSCRAVVYKGSTKVLGVKCKAHAPRSGGAIFPNLAVAGSHRRLAAFAEKPWITFRKFNNHLLRVNVQEWVNPPTAIGRYGVLTVRVRGPGKSIVWGFVEVVQSPK